MQCKCLSYIPLCAAVKWDLSSFELVAINSLTHRSDLPSSTWLLRAQFAAWSGFVSSFKIDLTFATSSSSATFAHRLGKFNLVNLDLAIPARRPRIDFANSRKKLCNSHICSWSNKRLELCCMPIRAMHLKAQHKINWSNQLNHISRNGKNETKEINADASYMHRENCLFCIR